MPNTKLLYICENLNEMPNIKNNFSLKELNSFGIQAQANYFVEIKTEEEIPELVQGKVFEENKKLILGGGSNILFTKNFDGLIIHTTIQGIELRDETENHVWVHGGCGVDWDNFVAYTVNNNWGGLENLSLIPGYVGAAPIQNIGAYGVEAGEIISDVEGFDFQSKSFQKYSRETCKFSYRNSIFKNELRHSFLVSGVTFKLSKANHSLNTRYGTIEKELENHAVKNIQTIRQSVIAIRESKLPDPDKIGNAGSFFKNPIVSLKQAKELTVLYPNIPVFAAGEKFAKLSAAWLIDKAGCKGITIGKAGTHEKQPLVIINRGGASGQEILDMAKHVRQKVNDVFGVELEPEVNII